MGAASSTSRTACSASRPNREATGCSTSSCRTPPPASRDRNRLRLRGRSGGRARTPAARGTIATRTGTAAPATAATTCCRRSCAPASCSRSSTGRVALGTWQRIVVVDPNRDNDVAERSAVLRAGLRPSTSRELEVLARRAVGPCRRRRDARLDVAFAQQHQILAVQLDLEARRREEQHTVARASRRGRRGRPARRPPTSGASVRAPRSPGSAGRSPTCARRCRGFARSSRSAGESNLAVRRLRSRFARLRAPLGLARPWRRDFLAGRRRRCGVIAGSVASVTGYDASPWKPGDCVTARSRR